MDGISVFVCLVLAGVALYHNYQIKQLHRKQQANQQFADVRILFALSILLLEQLDEPADSLLATHVSNLSSRVERTQKEMNAARPSWWWVQAQLDELKESSNQLVCRLIDEMKARRLNGGSITGPPVSDQP
jgi:hypothetical protein